MLINHVAWSYYASFSICYVTVALCDVEITVSPGKPDEYSDRTVCATHTGCLAAGHTTRVSCDNPVFGQTLYIDTLGGNNHTLILCEVAAASK